MGYCKLVQYDPLDCEFQHELKRVEYTCDYIKKNKEYLLKNFCDLNRVTDPNTDRMYINFKEKINEFLSKCWCNEPKRWCKHKNNWIEN